MIRQKERIATSTKGHSFLSGGFCGVGFCGTGFFG